MDGHREENEIVYPSIVFKIKDGLYSINSQYVTTIALLSGCEGLPSAPPEIMGILPFRDSIIPLLDLRIVFGLESLKAEYEGFADMLEMRKQDHIRWVEELERTMETGEKFTLATDPHQCAFGKWYDSYETKNSAIRMHLQKIDQPHKNLHYAAEAAANCSKQCELCKREECAAKVLERVKTEYMTEILKLLDEAKELFRSASHEMVLIMNDGTEMGVVVDEVLAVETLEMLDSDKSFDQFKNTRFVCGIQQCDKLSGTILELDSVALLHMNDEELVQQEA